MTPIYALAAGGTGGHLFPAEAVARLLVQTGGAVHLLTDRRADAFAEKVPGVTVDLVRAGRLGGGPLHAAYGLAELAVGIVQARRLLRRLAPVAVAGFGGYPSVPTMLAAAQLGLPTLIHEQNVVLGRANRLLAPRARRIATGFAATRGLRDADRARAIHTGNPVRPAIHAVGAVPYAPPGDTIELLVVGGSQGARIFGEIVPPALGALPPELRARLHVSQQARPEDKDTVTDGVSAARHRRRHRKLLRRHAGAIAPRASGDLPRRRLDDRRARRRRAAGYSRPLPARDGRPPDRQCRRIRRRRRVDDAAAASSRPAALAERLAALLADPAALSEAAAAARRFARDDAAERLARLVRELAPGNGHTLERAA